MSRVLYPLFLLALGLSPLVAATPGRAVDASLATILNFETAQSQAVPDGWGGGPPETIHADSTAPHGGRWCVRLERAEGAAGKFSSLSKTLPLGVSGRRIELRGFIRTEAVSEFAGLWLRIDGPDGALEFENMQRRQLNGTHDWAEYTVSVPLNPTGRRLAFGFLLGGTGRAWVDDLQLLVDGRPIWDAPSAEQIQTPLELDTEFASGSKVALHELSTVQIAHLATLARVWGFLKYHHPALTRGTRHWDFELFRILPAILAAGTQAEASGALLRWIDGLGDLPSAGPPHPEEKDPHLAPELDWLDDNAALGSALAARLRAVHAARPAASSQFFISLAPGVGNPEFLHEPAYPRVSWPDAGYQLLALFRYWNIIRYWFPYRDLIPGDWDAALMEFIPRIALARDASALKLELLALITRVHDTHANLWNGLDVRPPTGDAQLPFVFRFVGDQAVIAATLGPRPDPTALRRGDIVLAIDDQPVADLVRAWALYYAASNEPARLRDIARSLGRGPAGPVQLRIKRDGETLTLPATRVPRDARATAAGQTHDLSGPAFRLLSPEVAYLKLSAVRVADVRGYLDKAAGTKGWVIDIRNYPSEFVVFALGGHFVDRPTKFARFTQASPANPGAFSFGNAATLAPLAPRYAGRIVILVDEISQSSAEYTAMALRAAPDAVVVGSTTAGADGNVSRIPLPGGLNTMISGIGVFLPNKRPTQRVGIRPDITVTPTVAGLRDGHDEVLAEALRQILGPSTPAAQIRALSARED